jgi:hypothetical protein
MQTRHQARKLARLFGLSTVFTAALASSAFALTLNVTDADSHQPAIPHGATPSVVIGNLRGRTQTGFVRFDLTPLSAGTTITQAFWLSCAFISTT